MKFYNREDEMKMIRQTEERSRSTACFTAIMGRRRVGKTTLLRKALEGKKYIYLFVSRTSEVLLCDAFKREITDTLSIPIYGTPTRFRDLFELLMQHAASEHFTLIIDEFQDFDRVNPSIFSDIQNMWDRYSPLAKINFIVCGSIYSLMKHIFEDHKEPLFGRLTSKFVLKPFKTSVLIEILRDYNPAYTPDDLLCLYTLTGGVAKYVTLLMDAGAVTLETMIDFVTQPDSPLLTEGRDMLVQEFGRDYSTYFSILQLIASGYTRQGEIDGIIGKNSGPYLNNLSEGYSLIQRRLPLLSKPGTRNLRWYIADNFLNFWFRFIYPHQSAIELEKYAELNTYIKSHYVQYSGGMLEKYFRDRVAETTNVTLVGNYWDSKGENEIDLIALNDFEKKGLVAEVKRNPDKINYTLLAQKMANLPKEFSKYSLIQKGLSLDDMEM
ncbi:MULTISPECIES: ATP-binding protein [Bacteroides]|jgi:AAA+ ATPase superfamily predicted ATPase|uniref:ATP-binding protein n=1 Tax=Bacteroides TaxID=816 RepID=UPI00101B9FAF|nr:MULTISPECIES: ATP-binding protein [Bacteroides]MBU8972870.1 ATP-binding protein [Bacteroides eggerthii]MBU8997750.1 ATP-binding protein [Bacteroides eggerthii]MCG4759212.1 ATP-binding protein [Bacteroides eggerthii]